MVEQYAIDGYAADSADGDHSWRYLSIAYPVTGVVDGNEVAGA